MSDRIAVVYTTAEAAEASAASTGWTQFLEVMRGATTGEARAAIDARLVAIRSAGVVLQLALYKDELPSRGIDRVTRPTVLRASTGNAPDPIDEYKRQREIAPESEAESRAAWGDR